MSACQVAHGNLTDTHPEVGEIYLELFLVPQETENNSLCPRSKVNSFDFGDCAET